MRLTRLIAALTILTCTSAGWAQTEYYSILLDGKKVGYAINERKVEGDKVTTTEDLTLTIARLGVSLTIKEKETCVETKEGKPLSFSSVQDMGGLGATQAAGTIEDGKLSVTVAGGSGKEQKTMDWPEGAMLSEGLRLLTVKQGLRQGTSFKAKMFAPSMLTALESDVKVGALKAIQVNGQPRQLTEVVTTTKHSGQNIVSTSYVDKDCTPVKTVMPMMGTTIEMVAASKEVAMGKAEDVDFFDRLMLKSPSPIGDMRQVRSITYTLSLTNTAASFPQTDEQTPKLDGKDTVELTVRPIVIEKGDAFPYKGADPVALAALKSTRFVQSDNDKVVELAKQAVGDATDSYVAAKRIETFVRKYINKKNLGVGYASAADVAVTREGDCTEHAVLLAAMCRAVGIPAQVATGLGYTPVFGESKDVFGPHAWARAHINGKWVNFDAALNGNDAGHILFASGDGSPDDFFGLTNTLGYFKIAKVQIERAAAVSRPTTRPARVPATVGGRRQA